MVVPHYAYLKLKIPGNNGTSLTVHGSFLRSDNCDKDFPKIASKFKFKQELNALQVEVDHTLPPADNRATKSDECDVNTNSKKLQVHHIDPKKMVNTSLTSPSRRKACSSSSSVNAGKYLHGNHPTCQVFPGNSLSTPHY
jgi:hypothetical protein